MNIDSKENSGHAFLGFVMHSGTHAEPLNCVTNFNLPLLIHIVVCSSGLEQMNHEKTNSRRNANIN